MKVETKVGALFLSTLVGVGFFAYILGAFNPFSDTHDLDILFNFAGGIEEGSPVRVMGIKVGKVRSIIFDPTGKDLQGNEVKLRLRVSVEKRAWPTIRKDSRIFINLAGVIGEKFIEISPGSVAAGELEPGSIVRGVDPPRIDQLISQSYGLAGKILEFVEKNENTVTGALERVDRLITNLNRTLVLMDKVTKDQDIAKLITNLVKISDDIARVSGSMTDEEAKKTYALVSRLLWRLEKLDSKAIKTFLQEEGIKAKIF
jgi:phospholipid/cholesterol/gamma-HCH transport system substrate-binding protein